MLEVRGLSKRYGSVTALDGVDLDIKAGEICGLLGPNGAGKTTLVSIVAGLCGADGGSVRVDEIDALARSREARRRIGLAPQELGIYPVLTVRDNLRVFGELADLSGRALDDRIDEVADTLELTVLLARFGRELSGGEKRRVHTAMAMLHRPPLLLLDEPTTGVDVQTRARLLEAVHRLASEQGCAVCYSTHYLPEVEALGASVAIIEQGRVIARGRVQELIARHGRCAIELTFDGPPPAIEAEGRLESVEGKIRLYSEQPASDLAKLIVQLGPAADRLRGVEIVSASLETVFLALTGRRYHANGTDTSETNDVVAS